MTNTDQQLGFVDKQMPIVEWQIAFVVSLDGGVVDETLRVKCV
jgi:hypothetical protein